MAVKTEREREKERERGVLLDIVHTVELSLLMIGQLYNVTAERLRTV